LFPLETISKVFALLLSSHREIVDGFDKALGVFPIFVLIRNSQNETGHDRIYIVRVPEDFFPFQMLSFMMAVAQRKRPTIIRFFPLSCLSLTQYRLTHPHMGGLDRSIVTTQYAW
jgi:hypothetical protein